MTKNFPTPTNHGEIKQIFNDIYAVTGSVEMFENISISRAMTILKEGNELTIISPIRLDEDGMKQLDQLGDVKHIVKLGAYYLGAQNGIDDAYYMDRYDAKFWSAANMPHKGDLKTTDILGEEGRFPTKGMSLFQFESSKMPEAVIRLDKQGGILITADSLQNWETTDEFFSPAAAQMMQKAGFIQQANIGPEWFRHCEPKKFDFDALLELEFNHLLPSHGIPLLNNAKKLFIERIAKLA